MGDKNPKSKQKDQNQKSAAKSKNDQAKRAAAPVPSGNKDKKK